MADIFISYRRKDSPGHAGRLFEALRTIFGDDGIFMDVSDIPRGSEFPDVIQAAIASAKLCIAVIGPKWNAGNRIQDPRNWVRQEIKTALKRRIHILPILVGGAKKPERIPGEIAGFLRRQFDELRDDHWDDDIGPLVDRLKLILSPEIAAETKGGDQRILMIHDLDPMEARASWEATIKRIVYRSVQRWTIDPRRMDIRFVGLGDLLEAPHRDMSLTSQALESLWASLRSSGVTSKVPSHIAQGGQATASERIRRDGHIIARWLSDPSCRAKAQSRVEEVIGETRPDYVVAFGVGALVAYDLFARKPLSPRANRKRWLVTLGAPLGLPRVRAAFGGRIVPLNVMHWYNVSNQEDSPFCRPFLVQDHRFSSIRVSFPPAAGATQALQEYLTHEETRENIWRCILLKGDMRTSRIGRPRTQRSAPDRRALLVGINQYSDSHRPLRGCINDVFAMSAVLQEFGFDPENIQVLLNQRATAEAMRGRLQWLLEDARAGDGRVFHFSGHGARIPGYGPGGEADHLLECLAPWDFDSSPERCISDDWFCELYSQLPYQTNFLMILDCGFPIEVGRIPGGGARGLMPSVDMYQFLSRWDPSRAMWVPRSLRLSDSKRQRSAEGRTLYLGGSHTTKRLGRAESLLSTQRSSAEAEQTYKHHGPYTPVILLACQEEELAYEFRHGWTHYGAFTFCLMRILRELRVTRGPRTFEELIARVGWRLQELRYAQHPVLVRPQAKRTAPIPYLVAGRTKRG